MLKLILLASCACASALGDQHDDSDEDGSVATTLTFLYILFLFIGVMIFATALWQQCFINDRKEVYTPVYTQQPQIYYNRLPSRERERFSNV